MESIYSQGHTFGQIAYDDGAVVSFSVLSHRAARLALLKSIQGKWHKPVFAYEPIDMDPFIFVGFQPETGRHLAVLSRRGHILTA